MSDLHGASVFHQDWWLEAVAPGQWGRAAVMEGGTQVATLPFVVKHRLRFSLLTMPPLTQYLGPAVAAPNAKPAKAIGTRHQWIDKLVDQLPDFDYFAQPFHPDIYDWLPFYWRGFKQTSRYTYALELGDIDIHWKGLSDNIRRAIRKAENKVVATSDHSVDTLLDICKRGFARLGRNLPFDPDACRRAVAAALAKESGRMFFAEDSGGRVHAALFVAHDDRCAHYVIGGTDPDLRESGANSLLFWEAIKYATLHSRRFDFEGSMIPDVERFVRAFGGQQEAYHYVTCRRGVLEPILAGRDFASSLRALRR